jgi:hypothetical protein
LISWSNPFFRTHTNRNDSSNAHDDQRNHATTANMTSSFSFAAVFAVCLSLCSIANAHMKMSSPVPFNVANLDNSPLKADGSDFPCKASPNNPSSYSISAINKIPVDSPVALTFEGSAIHGGGTCELSISLDQNPTAESVFKVIQVFQGACPTATGGGLTFNIPKDFPNADQATLAWTWFNQIGNREMYMNCAPIQITGGSDNMNYFDTLPDMFKANIPTQDCQTEESTDPTMPDPGDFVLQDAAVKPGKVVGPKCGTAAPAQNANANSGKVTNFAAFSKPAKDSNEIIPVGGSSGGSGGNGASASAPATGGGGNNGMYTQPAASSAPMASTPAVGGGGNDGMYTQPGASSAESSAVATSSAASSAESSAIATSSAAASATTPASTADSFPTPSFQTMTVPASSATAAAPPYPTLSPSLGQGVSGPSSGSVATPSGSPSSSGSSSSSGSANTPGQCTTDGAVVCNGPTQFGLCSNGSVVWQAVAAGTECSGGAVQKRSAHVRRHAHGAFKVRAS